MTSFIYLLLICALLNGLSWIILTPAWQYPDEQAHFSQVQNLAEIGVSRPQSATTSLEIATAEEALGTNRNEQGNNLYTYHPEYHIAYSQNTTGLLENEVKNLPISSRTNYVKSEATVNPPVYYFIASLFYKAAYPFDLFTRLFTVRLFSLILFTALVLAAYKCAEIILKNKLLIYSLTALIAYKPMLTYASTGVLADPLTNLFFALVLYLCLLVIKNGVSKKYLLLLTAVVITGLNTRQQFLLCVPIIFVALFYDAIARKRNLKWVIIPLVLLSVLTILSNHVSNIPLLNSLHIPEFLVFEPGKMLPADFLSYITSALRKSYQETWPWYWGVYRWLSYTPPHIVYEVVNRIVLISGLGLSLYIFQALRKQKFDQHFFILVFMIISSAIYFVAFMLWDYFFIARRGYSFGFQGRYFFPLVIFHMAILLTGYWQAARLLLKKYAKYALLSVVILMIVFNNFTAYSLAGTFYPAHNLETFINQVSQYKPLFFKGNIIMVILLLNLAFQALLIAKFAKHVFKTNESSF